MICYDVIVIGGGAAGLTCAIGASKVGKKTLIIESQKLGGECTWNGCVPSKAFIATNSFEAARKVSEAVYLHESPEIMKNIGIDTLKEKAEFIDARTLRAGGELYRAKTFVIATGSTAFIPPIQGIDKTPILTTEDFFKLTSIPKNIAFIGGGVISLELAYPLARSGAKVTILEKSETLLPAEDPEVGCIFLETLKEQGINCKLGVDIKSISPEGGENMIRYRQGGEDFNLKAEKIFISAGRRARTEGFGLDKIGVEYSSRGIAVNASMQTNLPHIYAAGDCLDGFRFSHVAGRQGEIITRNIAFPWIKASLKKELPPFIMFGSPEYSRCGVTETEARKIYGDIKVYKADAQTAERAISSYDKHFNLRIFCHRGRIVGAWCLGDRAGEIISPLQFLMGTGIPFKKYAAAIQAYPGYGEILRKLAKAAMIDDLLNHPIVKLFRK